MQCTTRLQSLCAAHMEESCDPLGCGSHTGLLWLWAEETTSTRIRLPATSILVMANEPLPRDLSLRLPIWEAGNEKKNSFPLHQHIFFCPEPLSHACASSRIWNGVLLFTFIWVPWGLIVDVCTSQWLAFWLQFLLQSQPRSPRSWLQPLPGNNRPFLQNTGLSSFLNTQELVLWR